MVSLRAFATFDPLEIATEGVNGSGVLNEDIINILELNNLFYVLKENAVLLGAILLVMILASMHFINKSEKLAEKKAAILHVLTILLFIFSLIWILNIFIGILEYLF